MVDYATHIAILLQAGVDQIAVHCKNGRSRSPAVIAIFYMIFRGLSFEVRFLFSRTIAVALPVLPSVPVDPSVPAYLSI